MNPTDQTSTQLDDRLRTVTVHVGLPKTGTSTLQRHFFPRLSGYLGKFAHSATSDPERTPDAARELIRIRFDTNLSSEERAQRIHEWSVQHLDPELSSFFVSAEELSWWHTSPTSGHWPLQDARHDRNRLGTPALASFLADMKVGLGPKTRLRVVLTIRNQSAFLGSYYAEKRIFFPCFGQRDFTRRVRRLLGSSDSFLDWGMLATSLLEVLDSSDLQICIFEDGLERVAYDIKQFVDQDVDHTRLGHENVRIIAPYHWVVEGSKSVRFCRLRTRIRVGRENQKTTVQQMVHIRVNPKLRRAIRRRYDNRRMETLLGRRIDSLGY